METNPPATATEPSLPATATAIAPAMSSDAPGSLVPAAAQRHQPMSVAFLPLALAAFVVIAVVIAAWAFLAAA